MSPVLASSVRTSSEPAFSKTLPKLSPQAIEQRFNDFLAGGEAVAAQFDRLQTEHGRVIAEQKKILELAKQEPRYDRFVKNLSEDIAANEKLATALQNIGSQVHDSLEDLKQAEHLDPEFAGKAKQFIAATYKPGLEGLYLKQLSRASAQAEKIIEAFSTRNLNDIASHGNGDQYLYQGSLKGILQKTTYGVLQGPADMQQIEARLNGSGNLSENMAPPIAVAALSRMSSLTGAGIAGGTLLWIIAGDYLINSLGEMLPFIMPRREYVTGGREKDLGDASKNRTEATIKGIESGLDVKVRDEDGRVEVEIDPKTGRPATNYDISKDTTGRERMEHKPGTSRSANFDIQRKEFELTQEKARTELTVQARNEAEKVKAYEEAKLATATLFLRLEEQLLTKLKQRTEQIIQRKEAAAAEELEAKAYMAQLQAAVAQRFLGRPEMLAAFDKLGGCTAGIINMLIDGFVDWQASGKPANADFKGILDYINKSCASGIRRTG